VPTEQRSRAGQLGAQHEHVSHVRVGRVRLGVQVVAVVPADNQPEVLHRREHRRTGAHDGAHLSARHLQPGCVPRSRAEVSREHQVVPGADQGDQCRVDPR
jgi:hypothetical protein